MEVTQVEEKPDADQKKNRDNSIDMALSVLAQVIGMTNPDFMKMDERFHKVMQILCERKEWYRLFT
jgi:hypothetical protein